MKIDVLWTGTGAVLAALAFIVVFTMCDSAQAQTSDVPLDMVSGTYSMCCMSPVDSDMAEICFVRTDLDILEELGCAPAGPSEKVCKDLDVTVTTNVDAELHCYAKDFSGLISLFSPNAGTIDFTKPGQPMVVP